MIRMSMLIVVGLMAATQGALADAASLAKAIARAPARVETMIEDVIAGHGEVGVLSADGIEAHVALTRASARATVLRRYFALDLDADGSVDRMELAIARRAAAADQRGRMDRDFSVADADGNGVVDPAELAAAGRAAALRALDEEEAALLRGLLAFDGDGDGGVTREEIARGLAMAGSET